MSLPTASLVPFQFSTPAVARAIFSTCKCERVLPLLTTFDSFLFFLRQRPNPEQDVLVQIPGGPPSTFPPASPPSRHARPFWTSLSLRFCDITPLLVTRPFYKLFPLPGTSCPPCPCPHPSVIKPCSFFPSNSTLPLSEPQDKDRAAWSCLLPSKPELCIHS